MRRGTMVAAALLAVTGAACGDDAETPAGAGGTGGAGGASSTTSTGAGGAGGDGGTPDCTGRTDSDDPGVLAALDVLRAWMLANTVPGGAAIAVVKNGQTLGVGVIGSKVGFACDPITEDTLMNTTTAISELVTTMAVLDAVEEGVLDLDAPITDLVPLPASPATTGATVDDITLRHLLTHTSGYSSYWDRWSTPHPCTTLEASLGAEADDATLYWTPGEMHDAFMRSNTEIAGRALEVVDGASFAEVAHSRVLEPLRMGGLYGNDAIEATGDHAFGHYGALEDLPVASCENRGPSSGYYGSIRDVARFLEALTGDGGGVLEADSLALMLTPQGVHLFSDEYTPFGFDEGWHSDCCGAGGEDLLVTGSYMFGNLAQTHVFRTRGLAVAILLNSAEPYATSLAPLIEDIYTAVDPTLQDLPLWAPDYTPIALDVQSAAGTYHDPVGFLDSGPRTLVVTVSEDDPLALVGLLSGEFFEDTPVTFSPAFHRDVYDVSATLSEEHYVRFWRNEAGVTEAALIGYDGGPPFYRLAETP